MTIEEAMKATRLELIEWLNEDEDTTANNDLERELCGFSIITREMALKDVIGCLEERA